MKEPHFLSKGELRELFEQRKSAYNTSWQENGFVDALEALSRALRDLVDIGVNAHLQISSSVPEESFRLVEGVTKLSNSRRVTGSGVLTVDQCQYLVIFSNAEDKQENETKILKMYVSSREYGSRKLQSDFRGECFDLKDDVDGIQKFQRHVINIAAESEVINAHDVCNVFESTGIRRLNKSPLAPKPNRPSA